MANPSGESAKHEVFDASKQAKPPPHFLRSPPLALPAVRIGLVSPEVGYGLFAARDLAPDEFVFHEAPLLTAPFNEKFAADRALVLSQTAACRAALAAHRDLVAVAYPALAARLGVPPLPWEEARRVLEGGGLGMNLVVGGSGGGDGGLTTQFAGASVKQAEYEAYTAGIKVSASVSEADVRQACLDFFKHYAFQVPPKGSGGAAGVGGVSALMNAASTREACIYLLGSLVNHCCTPPPSASSSSASLVKGKNKGPPPGPNCSWRIGPSGLAHFVRPRHICVQARRAIREGEQLTWDYGKREKGFDCQCDTCRDGLIGGLGSCHVL
ncbi:uncharacterized protein P884DRAFT_197463 [Thermothelomyces heterothallicus CBS 202.75]|uniref:uncharacterized protein n=1 Tax=Thermothelomyces heterothallicus CBS 202.75 TaxID=1149848 RepID=UPI0037427761